MVPTAIRALRDKPRKGSSLSAIKGFMAEEWGINIQTYAPKIKKYILKAVENGELLQTKGKGAAGRFTVPGLKARKRKSKTTKRLSKKFDEDEVEYEPGKSARDEAREQTEVVLIMCSSAKHTEFHNQSFCNLSCLSVYCIPTSLKRLLLDGIGRAPGPFGGRGRSQACREGDEAQEAAANAQD